MLSSFQKTQYKSVWFNTIIDTLQYAYVDTDNGKFVIQLFLDFATTFDPVDHGILFLKMSMFGVRGVTLRLVLLLLNVKRVKGIHNLHKLRPLFY